MALILTDKDLESFETIAVKTAGRNGRFSHLHNDLQNFAVGMFADITDELNNEELIVLNNFVANSGNVSSDDRKAIRSVFSAFLRELRKIDKNADCRGSYRRDKETGNAHYVVKRVK